MQFFTPHTPEQLILAKAASLDIEHAGGGVAVGVLLDSVGVRAEQGLLGAEGVGHQRITITPP